MTANGVVLPPHSEMAEKYLLGTMLQDNSIVPDVLGIVRANSFYNFANQKVFEAISSLCDRGKTADIVTVGEWLSETRLDPKKKDGPKLIDDVGFVYLAQLSEYSGSGALFRQYADTVAQAFQRREMIALGAELQSNARDLATGTDELLGRAEQRLFGIADTKLGAEPIALAEGMRQFWGRMDARRGNPDARDGVLTGWVDVDRLTDGFRNSELVLIAARPGVGKSAWGIQFAMNVAIEQRLPVMVVSLEQAAAELTERMICNRSRVGSFKIRTNRLGASDIEKIMQAGDLLSEAKIWIDDVPSQDMMRIASRARRMKQKSGLRLLVIDYLQLIEPDDKRSKRHEQVGTISRRLKILAKELDMPVVCMAQVNRGSEERADREPRLAELRESGSLEQDADTVILLHKKTDDGFEMQVNVAKNRNGPTGKATLMWVPEFMRFENFVAETSSSTGGTA